jgi:nucleoside-diphosphate-sugar epimerase
MHGEVPVADEEELEERHSRPTPAVVDELSQVKGDIIVLGAGGKMGPSLARMAERALRQSGSRSHVIAVARFSSARSRESVERAGVRTISCDLLDRAAVGTLPDAAGLIFMAGTKFGTSGAEAATWATNCHLAGLVAERYPRAPTVVFSSGNVYPLVPVTSGGAMEETRPAPVGEYAQSVLGRERIFEFFSRRHGTPVTILRLNYAVELRYGILLDVASKVRRGEPIDLRMGYVNVIWQGDANAVALRCLSLADSPPVVLNVTGAETISVRRLAERFAQRFGCAPRFCGEEAEDALLSNADRARQRFGPYAVSLDTAIEWVARWIETGGPRLAKPTHFERRDGSF